MPKRKIDTYVFVTSSAVGFSGKTLQSQRTLQRDDNEPIEKFINRVDDAIESAECDVHAAIADESPWQSTVVRADGPAEVHVMPNDGCHDERRRCPCGPCEIQPGLWLHRRTATA